MGQHKNRGASREGAATPAPHPHRPLDVGRGGGFRCVRHALVVCPPNRPVRPHLPLGSRAVGKGPAAPLLTRGRQQGPPPLAPLAPMKSRAKVRTDGCCIFLPPCLDGGTAHCLAVPPPTFQSHPLTVSHRVGNLFAAPNAFLKETGHAIQGRRFRSGQERRPVPG